MYGRHDWRLKGALARVLLEREREGEGERERKKEGERGRGSRMQT